MAKTIDQKKGVTIFQLDTLNRMLKRSSVEAAGEAFKAYVPFLVEGIDPYSLIKSEQAAFILDVLYPSKEDSERVYLQKAIDGRYGAYKQECKKNDDTPEDRETWEKVIDFPAHPDDYVYSTDEYFIQALKERSNPQQNEMIWNPTVDQGIPEDTTVDQGIPKESTVSQSNRIKSPRTDNKSKKHKYGHYRHVLLSDSELEKLKELFPSNWEYWIEKLDEGIELHDYKYKNHLLAIIKWAGDNKNSQTGSGETEVYELV